MILNVKEIAEPPIVVRNEGSIVLERVGKYWTARLEGTERMTSGRTKAEALGQMVLWIIEKRGPFVLAEEDRDGDTVPAADWERDVRASRRQAQICGMVSIFVGELLRHFGSGNLLLVATSMKLVDRHLERLKAVPEIFPQSEPEGGAP